MDDLGDLEFNPTNEQIAQALLDFICPWTGDDPTTDHRHTPCMWIGLAIQRLRTPENVETCCDHDVRCTHGPMCQWCTTPGNVEEPT